MVAIVAAVADHDMEPLGGHARSHSATAWHEEQPDRPVRYDPRLGLWVVHRYEDVRRVLLDPEVFRPDNALTAITPLRGQSLRTLARAGVSLPGTLANNGTATHPSLRRLVAQFLTPPRVRAQRPVIERIANSHLDAVEAKLGAGGTCDLVPALAGELPAEVLLDILDLEVPYRPDIQALKGWSAASFELFWGWPSAARQASLASEVAAFHQWLVTAIETARRDTTGSGLLAALAAHRDHRGRPLGVAGTRCSHIDVADDMHQHS